jgi:hypothetical protein
MEHGFFHPLKGYWQTLSTPSSEVLASYPNGTTEIPLKPGDYYEWTGAEWVYTPNLEELAAIAISKRNQLLSESDWTQLPDSRAAMDAEKAAQWDAYRQALRDVSGQSEFPTNIAWPVNPQ